MLKENRADMRRIMDSLVVLTGELERATAGGKLDSTLTVARNAAVSLDSTMVTLRATTEQARQILAGLREGEGTVGRLLTDDALYDRADSTLQSLDRLIDQMRRDPKSMIKMSVF